MKNFLKTTISALFIIAIVGIVYLMHISNNFNPENYKKISDIPTPSGYVRVTAEKGSFGNYLRNLPLKPKDSKIKLYKGEEASLQFMLSCVSGGQVLANHQRNLKDDGVIKLTQVQTGQLLDLLQAVNQSVAVNKQLPGGLGNVPLIRINPIHFLRW